MWESITTVPVPSNKSQMSVGVSGWKGYNVQFLQLGCNLVLTVICMHLARFTYHLDKRLEGYESAPPGQQPALLQNTVRLDGNLGRRIDRTYKRENSQGYKTLAHKISFHAVRQCSRYSSFLLRIFSFQLIFISIVALFASELKLSRNWFILCLLCRTAEQHDGN